MKTYRITELGRRFGLSRSTLLYYDRIGLLKPGGRTDSGYRVYTQENLDRLERIYFFREAGLSLEDIARLLDSTQNEISILEKRLREIGQEMSALKSQQRLITGILKTVTDNFGVSGLDKELWLGLQKACGLDEAALRSWHREFERRAPDAHHEFLLSLGLSEKEAIQIRMLTKSMEDNKMRMKHFYELFEKLPRQGPGNREATLKALGLLGNLPPKPKVLDIGCGSGAQTLILAEELDTKILAIDNHRPVLNRLDQSAKQTGLNIETQELSMLDMPFGKDSFDLLWAEGSIFIIGLTRGLKEFATYLKSGGYIVFSELCWFENNPPAEAKAYFDNVYPDIRTVDEVISLITASDYTSIGHFNLPDRVWWDSYFNPLLERMKDLQVKNAGVAEAEAVYADCRTETDMFRKHSKSYGYTYFVARKKGPSSSNDKQRT